VYFVVSNGDVKKETEMTQDEFLGSVAGAEPPEGLTPKLTALWYAQKGDWERAHTVAQDMTDADGSWIHANLHREEGDLGNAQYWYRRSGRTMRGATVEEERLAMIEALLG
jgi:hypothetical protein